MKKIIAGILSILTIGCLAVGMAGCKDDETVESSFSSEQSISSTEEVTYSENLAYIISEDESYYILRGVGLCADRRIVIPSTYRGLPVKEIEDRAFQGQSYISSIFIPDGVTSIGNYAFSGCSSLTSVEIGDSVTSIGNYAFYYCESLTSIEFTGTVAQWKTISKGSYWKYNVQAKEVVCKDGRVDI